MLYTKELVSGRDIDLRNVSLGMIKQLKVEDFMGDMDDIDFIKPFYLERCWRANGVFDEEEIPLTLFFVSASKNPQILVQLMKCLEKLYNTTKVEIKELDKGDMRIFIRKEIDGKLTTTAVIDDSNFDILCELVILLFDYPEPKKEEKEKIEGDADKIALFEKFEKEYKDKHKDKKTIVFEEVVREVIHMKKSSYEDIKSLTIWQLKDAYKTYSLMENSSFEKMLASNGHLKIDKMKKWQEQTKIVRENAK